MKYDKIGYFDLTSTYDIIALFIGTILFHFLRGYIMLFTKLNHEDEKNELKKGFSHHVKEISLGVKGKSNNANGKRSDARSKSTVDEARMNHVNIKDIIEGVFTFIVNAKCTIASKKAFTVR